MGPTDAAPARGVRGFDPSEAKRPRVAIDVDALTGLRTAVLSHTPISLGPRRTASPHEFYRYPARFSPELAASAIAAFSRPGDLVADYFVGGGTTLVEARRAGRLAMGSDINSLSVFVSHVKTSLYGREDLAEVLHWSHGAAQWKVRPGDLAIDPDGVGVFRNVTSAALVEHRDFLLGGVAELLTLNSRQARALARCILLRTAQWALDMRREVPAPEHLRDALAENAQAMVAAARQSTREYRTADAASTGRRGLARSLVLHQGLPGVAEHPRLRKHPPPRLVLTSPPYPGVYVNYHRWKVRGRQETPFPYFLAGQSDGNGLAYYTMAARSDPSQRTYFKRLEDAFRDVARLCDGDTHIVQVVGFNDVEDQLPPLSADDASCRLCRGHVRRVGYGGRRPVVARRPRSPLVGPSRRSLDRRAAHCARGRIDSQACLSPPGQTAVSTLRLPSDCSMGTRIGPSARVVRAMISSIPGASPSTSGDRRWSSWISAIPTRTRP